MPLYKDNITQQPFQQSPWNKSLKEELEKCQEKHHHEASLHSSGLFPLPFHVLLQTYFRGSTKEEPERATVVVARIMVALIKVLEAASLVDPFGLGPEKKNLKVLGEVFLQH